MHVPGLRPRQPSIKPAGNRPKRELFDLEPLTVSYTLKHCLVRETPGCHTHRTHLHPISLKGLQHTSVIELLAFMRLDQTFEEGQSALNLFRIFRAKFRNDR